MKKAPLLALVLSAVFAFAATSYATVNISGPIAEPSAAGGAPVIAEAYAAPTIYPGQTWRVYLKASDPSGGMRYIVSEVSQPGAGESPVSYTRVKGDDAKELNGYVYLNTAGPSGYASLYFSTLTLTIQIKDNAGRYSRPVELALYFDPRAPGEQATPPAGLQNRDLGPIMIPLHPFVGG